MYKRQRYKRELRVISEHEDRIYPVPYGARLKVEDGQKVNAGDELTEGSINPHELLKVKGVRGVQLYLLQEVQWVYRMQGVDINDKHIEVIIRQMLKKVKVEDPGDTDLLPGGITDSYLFDEINEMIRDCLLYTSSSTRVMGTASSMGQAIGTAAAMAIERGWVPRQVGEAMGELQQRLLADDAYIPAVQRVLPALTLSCLLYTSRCV